MQYLSLCIGKGLPIAGEIRLRLDSWDYMAYLFAGWPSRKGMPPQEPATITEATTTRPVEATSEPVQAGTGAGKGKSLYYLDTAHNRQELASIFARLVEAGYIDGSAREALADFLNAFDPTAEKQGRITWVKKARSKQLNKMAICDFLRLYGITEREDLKEYALAIFGEVLSGSTISNSAGGSIERDELRTIIDTGSETIPK